jgi:hypothetical protein
VEGDDQGNIPKTFILNIATSYHGIGNAYTMNKIFDKSEIKTVIMSEVKIHRIQERRMCTHEKTS